MSDNRLLIAGGVGVLAAVGIWAARRWPRGKSYDDLDGIVSFSSRLVAGMRAIETQEEDALFRDPLAEVLAGQKGISAARATLRAYGEAGNEEGPQQNSKRRYAVGRVTLRTLFFDEHVLSAVRAGARQVVLLGAGMDCRAWRLDLPAGVTWFEVDMPDVLRAKHKALAAAGASFSSDSTDAGAQHPLKAASYTSLTVDLEREGWSEDLLAAGFDPATPSVWVAEGLVMYLSEAAVEKLLREAHRVSAKGSRLLVMAFTAPDVKRWYQDSATQAPADWVRDLAAQFKSSFPADVRAYLGAQGWGTAAQLTYKDLAAEYARGLDWTAHLGFLPAGCNDDNNGVFVDAAVAHEEFVEAVSQ